MQQELRNEHRNEENHLLIHLSKETGCFLSLFFFSPNFELYQKSLWATGLSGHSLSGLCPVHMWESAQLLQESSDSNGQRAEPEAAAYWRETEEHTWLTLRCYCRASSASFVVEGDWCGCLCRTWYHYSMHSVHLIQIVWFTDSTFLHVHVFVLWFLWTVCFTRFYRAGCKTCAILACKHWIFLFPGYGDDTDGVSKKDMKINLFKLRPCKTKPTRFTKWWVNQQRPDSDVTSGQCVTTDLFHSSTFVFTLSASCAYSLSAVILSDTSKGNI